jgi:hypothetical protein
MPRNELQRTIGPRRAAKTTRADGCFRSNPMAPLRLPGFGATSPLALAIAKDRLPPTIGIGDTSRCHPSHTTGYTGHVPGGSTLG